MKKRYIYGLTIAVITVAVLAAILVSDAATDRKFDRYKQYANELNVVDWTISEDTAQTFADANCDKLAVGETPAIKYRNESHVKSSAAVIAAYCPDSFDNFLAGIIMNGPEYKETALYINEEIRVPSS